MALIEFLLKIEGILFIKGRFKRVKTKILEAELETLGYKTYIAALKLFRVDYKTPQLIAQSCRNSRSLIKLDLYK